MRCNICVSLLRLPGRAPARARPLPRGGVEGAAGHEPRPAPDVRPVLLRRVAPAVADLRGNWNTGFLNYILP